MSLCCHLDVSSDAWPNRVGGRIDLPALTPQQMQVRVRLFQMPAASMPTGPTLGQVLRDEAAATSRFR
jgi:hypothetical protein